MVTQQERTQLIGLSVVMLGSAPGTTRLGEWVDYLNDGMTLEELAVMIQDSDEFQMEYPIFLLDDDFADQLLINLGLDTLDGEVYAAVVDIIVGLLNGGMERGEIALLVTQALLDISDQGMDHPAYGDLGAAADALANKVEVAEYYTVDARMEMPSADVLMGVTDDPDTVMMARDMIDNPPAPPPMGKEFTLTTRIDRETGGDGDDLFIAHSSPAGTDTLSRLDKLDGGAGMDTLDLASSAPEGFDLSSTIRVSNIENLIVNTQGKFTANLGSWMGLENINLQIIGSDADGKSVELMNAGGAMVTAELLMGDAMIDNASMVDLMMVASDATVNIGTSTASVSVNGAASVTIGAEGSQSAALTSASLTGTGINVGIFSDVISELSLSDTSAQVKVTNMADEAVDLTINVNNYGGDGDMPIELDGTGSAETVNFVAAGDSSVALDSDTTKMINVSGEGMFDFIIPNELASSAMVIENITVTGDVEFLLDGGIWLTKLKSFDASGASGNVEILDIQATAESISTGSGDDQVVLSGMDNPEGLSVDLGAGDDIMSYTSSGANTTRIEGGAGTDTLQLTDASYSGFTVDGTATGASTYSGFEILDIGFGSGSYNMALLHGAGIRAVHITGDLSADTTLEGVRAGTDVTVIGVNVNEAVTYNLADATGENDSATFNFMARGDGDDTAMGEAQAELIANGIEHIVINSNAMAGGEASAAAYENVLSGSADAVKTLVINGDAQLDATGFTANKVTQVDARGNSAGVTVTISGGAEGSVSFRGGMGNDTFTGGTSADVIIGGAGNDTLTGGAGSDTITGGMGADMLTGGPSNGDNDAFSDTFRYTSAADSMLMFNDEGEAMGYDTVVFTTTGETSADKIGLRGVGVGLADLQAFYIKDPLGTTSLMDYVGNGDNFFVRGPDDPANSDQFAIALVEGGEGTFLFIDVNGNGDLDLESDMAILLAGGTIPSGVTGDHFVLL